MIAELQLQYATTTIAYLSCCIRHQQPSRNIKKKPSRSTCTSCCSAVPSHPLCCEFHSAAAVTSCRPCSLSTYSPIRLHALTACIPISQNDSRMMDHFPAKKCSSSKQVEGDPPLLMWVEHEREKQKPWQGNHLLHLIRFLLTDISVLLQKREFILHLSVNVNILEINVMNRRTQHCILGI